MIIHEASEFGRVLRAQRCRCGEFPQLHFHSSRCAVWFACPCGKISEDSKQLDFAICNWNRLNTWGDE